LGIVNAQIITTPDVETEVETLPMYSTDMLVDNQDEQKRESPSRSITIELNMKRSLSNVIPIEIIQTRGAIDSSLPGWPEILEPPETNCDLCNSVLGEGQAHPGSRGKFFC
jgi:hypothetical protein